MYTCIPQPLLLCAHGCLGLCLLFAHSGIQEAGASCLVQLQTQAIPGTSNAWLFWTWAWQQAAAVELLLVVAVPVERVGAQEAAAAG